MTELACTLEIGHAALHIAEHRDARITVANDTPLGGIGRDSVGRQIQQFGRAWWRRGEIPSTVRSWPRKIRKRKQLHSDPHELSRRQASDDWNHSVSVRITTSRASGSERLTLRYFTKQRLAVRLGPLPPGGYSGRTNKSLLRTANCSDRQRVRAPLPNWVCFAKYGTWPGPGSNAG